MKYSYFTILIAISLVFQVHATDWYVDNSATGANSGTSWTNAWQNFTDIQWTSIQPGDTIYISGGETEKTYNEQLNIQASGIDGLPIIIKVGQDAPHNGNVIITNNGPSGGILISNRSYITIDGNVGGNRKIIVQDCTVAGVYVYISHHIILSYLYIYRNGEGGPSGANHGIVISSNEYVKPLIEVSYCHIRDNWQDQIAAFAASYAPDFGYVLFHHNEISELNVDGFSSGMGGIDFYNNTMHDKSFDGGIGHTDGLQFYGEYYRIYNNRFYNFIEANAYIQVAPYNVLGLPRPAKEIYVYNNLIYEETIAPTGDTPQLRGIVFPPNQNSTNSISNILIANNTIVNVPITGLGAKFNDLSAENINNVIVANNIIHNCYTIGGGTAVNIYDIVDDSIIGSFGSGAKIIFDNNCISAGDNGGGHINYNGQFVDHDELVGQYNLNISGINNDPGLDAEYKPDNSNDPTVDAGLDLSYNFNHDLNGISRPQGSGWDIGAYEYTTLTNINNESSEKMRLQRIYPNPFKSSATIEYSLPEGSDVEIVLYDLTGRKIENLYSGYQNSGVHTLSINAGDHSNGVYFCRIRTELYDLSSKCMISK